MGPLSRADPLPGNQVMPVNVNCTQCLDGQCLHPAVPPVRSKLFSARPFCVLVTPHPDPRVPRNVCAIQVVHQSAVSPQINQDHRFRPVPPPRPE